MGMAGWLFCLIYASLIASAGALVMLVFRKLITLRAGPRVTVGLWCFLLLGTALSLLWLNGQNMLFETFMWKNVRMLSFYPRIELMLHDMWHAVYPPEKGILARFTVYSPAGLRVFDSTFNAGPAVAAVFCVWASGVVVFWLRVLVPYFKTKRLLRRLPDADDPKLVRAIYIERSYLGITKRVRAVFLPGAAPRGRAYCPCVMGVRSPTLLLPEEVWAGLTPEERDAVVAHELMHVKKRDNVRNFVLLVFHGVFWFAPIFRIALRVMRRDLEFLRDREVLGAGATGREKRIYAGAIVSVAEKSAGAYRPTLDSGMLTGSGVGFRVRLLDSAGKGKPALRALAWLAAFVTVLAVPAVIVVFYRLFPLFEVNMGARVPYLFRLLFW